MGLKVWQGVCLVKWFLKLKHEFFGWLLWKVAAFIGPLLYGLMTVMFDSRVGILSIAMLILIGAVMMRMVDLEQGRADAQAEDAKNRD